MFLILCVCVWSCSMYFAYLKKLKMKQLKIITFVRLNSNYIHFIVTLWTKELDIILRKNTSSKFMKWLLNSFSKLGSELKSNNKYSIGESEPKQIVQGLILWS